MTISFTIINPGFISLIVDAGRTGMQEQGFSGSGPLDVEAFNFANWLCGNPEGNPCIEIAGDAHIRFEHSATIGVCGPAVSIAVNGEPASELATVNLSAGDEVQVSQQLAGQRFYLAVQGAWQIPEIAGSVCTVMREKLGGLAGDGKPLHAGDTIQVVPAAQENISRILPASLLAPYDSDAPVDIIPAYQHDMFSSRVRATFYSSAYSVTPQSDRMGYRLSGPAISSGFEVMRSEGINCRSVQVPADGQPIIMLADRQTLGGYPKIGVISPYDLPRVAQSVPGTTLTFNPVDPENARGTWLLRQARIDNFFRNN